MWLPWALLIYDLTLLKAQFGCDSTTLTEESYISTGVNFSLSCLTNQVQATYWQEDINVFPLTVTYSCVAPNGKYLNGTIIEGKIARNYTGFAEIPCGSLCSFISCSPELTQESIGFRLSISETCLVCAEKDSDICNIPDLTFCSASHNSFCLPSIHLENGTLDCNSCIDCNDTMESITSHMENNTSEQTSTSTLHIGNTMNDNSLSNLGSSSDSEQSSISPSNYRNARGNIYQYFLTILLILVPTTVILLTASILICQIKSRKKQRSKRPQLHIDKTLISDLQINLFNTNLSIHSDSMWSVFDSFYQGNASVSQITSSSEKSSLNCETPLIDEAGYITATNSKITSEKLPSVIKEKYDSLQCKDEVP